jgi:hypothetical protein
VMICLYISLYRVLLASAFYRSLLADCRQSGTHPAGKAETDPCWVGFTIGSPLPK